MSSCKENKTQLKKATDTADENVHFWRKTCISTEFGPVVVNAATIYQSRVTQDINSNRW